MVRLISRQRGGLAALKLTKLFGIDDFPAAKDSGKVLIIIIYCYLVIIIIIIIIIFIIIIIISIIIIIIIIKLQIQSPRAGMPGAFQLNNKQFSSIVCPACFRGGSLFSSCCHSIVACKNECSNSFSDVNQGGSQVLKITQTDCY